MGKGCIIGKPKIGDVCHNVIRALRLMATESGFCEVIHKTFTILIIFRYQIFMVTRWQIEGDDPGTLKRMRRADGEEVVHFTDRIG